MSISRGRRQFKAHWHQAVMKKAPLPKTLLPPPDTLAMLKMFAYQGNCLLDSKKGLEECLLGRRLNLQLVLQRKLPQSLLGLVAMVLLVPVPAVYEPVVKDHLYLYRLA